MNKALIAIDRSKSLRVYLTISTDLVQEAAKIHDTTPLASAGLGRVLTAAGLMGIMLKDDDNKLTLHFKGDGPARQILATAYGDGRVKGYISNPYVDLPLNDQGKLDVGGSLGVGDLTVIKDLGLKEPYTGTIALVDGEIADDLTAYFYISEQQNSSVALGVKVERDLSIGAAGGMIIQMLPDAQEGAVDALEKMIGAMPPLTTLISGLSGSFDPEIDRPAEAASADDSGSPPGRLCRQTIADSLPGRLCRQMQKTGKQANALQHFCRKSSRMFRRNISRRSWQKERSAGNATAAGRGSKVRF